MFSNGSIEKGSNRMTAGNEQTEHIQEWLRMLLFEVMHVLAQVSFISNANLLCIPTVKSCCKPLIRLTCCIILCRGRQSVRSSGKLHLAVFASFAHMEDN